MTEPTLNLTALWRLLTPEEQLEAAASFWRSESPLKKRISPQVVSALAAALNFRDRFFYELNQLAQRDQARRMVA